MKKLILAAALAACVQQAYAVDIKAGEWTVSVGGIVNAYYTSVGCSGDDVGGIALAGRALGCGGQDRRTTVGNGLLPNALITSVSSTQGGYDIGATIGLYPTTATDSAISQNSEIDARQAFFTFGNTTIGTVKLGRDYGIFSHNAILSDMTLIGAGAPVQATQRGRVTLGHLGAGYNWPGIYGQIAYTTPKNDNGISVDVGIMSPVTDTPIVAASRYSTRSAPQFQGRVQYDKEGIKGWVAAKWQHFESTTAGFDNFGMWGVEFGGSWEQGPWGATGNAQFGKGLGILSDGDEGDVKGKNFFLQGTYKLTEPLKLGVSYGYSSNDDNTVGTGGLKSNSNLTLGAYWKLNNYITLVGEIGTTRSKGFNSSSARLNGGSFGGIIFF
jgi:predicted porin